MKHILIIDDEADIREIAQASLEVMKNWAVTTACSGQEGIARAAADQPDAILLDVMLPDMDGTIALQKLQENPITCQIPVIFLTAKVRGSDQRRLAEMKVSAILAKPFNPEDLADQIANTLGWDASE
ncbi:MAG: response regulator [Leptolyngbyaceae cyanobacterium CSU_1_3]|nr:response regulator [Leptolyngbyaceae cyanobacterium CSU_1_3]